MANRERGHAYASLLIPADAEKWNPLEFTTAVEYVPALWDGPHCGVRLVQAFKTLSTLPPAKGPSSRSGYWPSAPMEWIDIVAKEHEYLNDPGQAREAAQQWARTRHRCTPEEVSRMEAALSWAGHYLGHRPLVARVVQSVAQFRSVGWEGDRIARRLRKPAAMVRRTNRAGLDAIAAGLRRDGAAVF
jgi:hypothetical protein